MSIYVYNTGQPLVRELTMTPVEGGIPAAALRQPEMLAETNAPGEAPDVTEPAPFADMLREVVGSADQSLRHAESVTTSFARGEQNDLHGTMNVLAQANIRLRLLGETRNHLLEAYREVMRMNV
jgi:flagellar hook-basal body complex protein FliE